MRLATVKRLFDCTGVKTCNEVHEKNLCTTKNEKTTIHRLNRFIAKWRDRKTPNKCVHSLSLWSLALHNQSHNVTTQLQLIS